jgi:hypothetical protein
MLTLSFAIARLALRTVRAAGGGGGFSPSLTFSDARNSQYLTLMF